MERAKIFMNGKSQAVRLPKKYRFKSDEVLIQEHPAGILLIDPSRRWELLEKTIADYAGEDLSRPEQLPWTEREDLE